MRASLFRPESYVTLVNLFKISEPHSVLTHKKNLSYLQSTVRTSGTINTTHCHLWSPIQPGEFSQHLKKNVQPPRFVGGRQSHSCRKETEISTLFSLLYNSILEKCKNQGVVRGHLLGFNFLWKKQWGGGTGTRDALDLRELASIVESHTGVLLLLFTSTVTIEKVT